MSRESILTWLERIPSPPHTHFIFCFNNAHYFLNRELDPILFLAQNMKHAFFICF